MGLKNIHSVRTNREYCEKHPTSTIHPKYGKCFVCRIEDGDIKKCDVCQKNYHDPAFKICYKCNLENKEQNRKDKEYEQGN